MDDLVNAMDELKLNNDKNIKKSFEQDEKILISCELFKFNRKNKRQERQMMVTNKAIYNLEKNILNNNQVKRRIPVETIQGITVSKQGSEFVVHVPDEYDYRYSSFDRRDKVLESICSAYCQTRKGQLLAFYYKEDISLENFTTTKPDSKKGISKMPQDNPFMMNAEIFKKTVQGVKEQMQKNRQKTATLFSRKQGQDVTIEDFNLLKVLGRGAFGKVMLCEKKDTKELFAIKSLRKAEVIENEQIEHTKTEKMILEHVNHPFLVNLAYAFQTPEKIFFVMNFMKGGELFQHLRKAKKFDETRARLYAAQILLGLIHLHSKDIVYRDIKPENILMDEQGNVCLTDFGMAKLVKKDEVAMSFCGTPEYLAPEIITGVGHNQSADLWSFGILIYEMLYGIPPFYSQNQNAMFQQIRDNQVRFPTHTQVSDDAKDLILRLLNKDQKQRIGANDCGQEIVSHKWFSSINFKKLLAKEIDMPYKPQLSGDSWVQNFDQDFTQEEAINSVMPGTNLRLIKEYEDEFRDFERKN